MDPGIIPTAGGDASAYTVSGIVSAVAIGLGLAAKWFMDRKQRDAANGVTVANDQAAARAAISVDSAIQIQAQMIADLRAQVNDLSQRIQSSADARNESALKVATLERDVADLKAQNTRLIGRVQILEGQLHAAGLPVPPETQ